MIIRFAHEFENKLWLYHGNGDNSKGNDNGENDPKALSNRCWFLFSEIESWKNIHLVLENKIGMSPEEIS